MKIDTTKPRLPIDRTDRFKYPLKPVDNEADESLDISLAGKEGEELERIVKRLYEQKIKR